METEQSWDRNGTSCQLILDKSRGHPVGEGESFQPMTRGQLVATCNDKTHQLYAGGVPQTQAQCYLAHVKLWFAPNAALRWCGSTRLEPQISEKGIGRSEVQRHLPIAVWDQTEIHETLSKKQINNDNKAFPKKTREKP